MKRGSGSGTKQQKLKSIRVKQLYFLVDEDFFGTFFLVVFFVAEVLAAVFFTAFLTDLVFLAGTGVLGEVFGPTRAL